MWAKPTIAFDPLACLYCYIWRSQGEGLILEAAAYYGARSINRWWASSRRHRSVKLVVYRKDVRISRHRDPRPYTRMFRKMTRGVVAGFSKSSAKRLVFTANNAVGLKTILTVTYGDRYPTNGRTAKAHLFALRKRLLYRYPTIGGLWFMEFQTRGAVHFHLLVNQYVNYKWLAAAWSEVVGDSSIFDTATEARAIRKPAAVGAYVAKYAAKEQQKQVPEDFTNPGRFWGTFGNFDDGKVWEGECEEGGELEVVSRVMRRALSISGGGRQGMVFRGFGQTTVKLLCFYGLWEWVDTLRCVVCGRVL